MKRTTKFRNTVNWTCFCAFGRLVFWLRSTSPNAFILASLTLPYFCVIMRSSESCFFFFQPVEERNEREETRRSRDFVLCALLRPSLIKIPIHCYVLFDTCNNFCFFNDFWILKRQMRWLCNWFLIASRSNASQGPCQEKKAHKYWRNSINLICPIMQRSCRFKIPHLFVR